MLTTALVAGGSLMCAPLAHAGTWSIKVDTKDVLVGKSYSYGTYKMEDSSFTKKSVGTPYVTNSFGVKPYPSTPAVSNNGQNATFDRTVSVTITLHYNGGTNDLPPKIVTVQMNGDVGGYYSLPPTGWDGGSSSLQGTTGLTDDNIPPVDTPMPNYPTRHQVPLTGKSLVTIPNPKQNQDIVIGPILLKHNSYIGSASKFNPHNYGYGQSGSTSTSYDSEALTADISLSGTLTNYGLYISTDIEQSYKKTTSWGDLPLKKDANGVDIPGQVDASQISPATPPYGADGIATSGPWGVVCKRDLAGKLTVESAAQWIPGSTILLDPDKWVGGVGFYANEMGFRKNIFGSVASRVWTYTGGQPRKVMADDLASGQQGGGGLADIGSKPDGSDLLKSSTLKVTTTDSDKVSLSNSYTINWHLPQEWETSPVKTLSPVWDSVEPIQIIQDKCTASGSVTGRWRWQNFYVGALLDKDEGDVFGLAKTLSDDPLQALFYHACGIYGQKLSDEDQTTQDGIFKTIWDSDMNNDPSTSATWFGNRPKNADGSWNNSDTEKVKWRLTNPRMLKKYQVEFYHGDAYGPNGYGGPIHRALRRRIPGTWISGDFMPDADNN